MKVGLADLVYEWLQTHEDFKKLNSWVSSTHAVVVLERKPIEAIEPYSDEWYQSSQKNYLMSVDNGGVAWNLSGVKFQFEVRLNPADPKFFDKLADLVRKSDAQNR